MNSIKICFTVTMFFIVNFETNAFSGTNVSASYSVDKGWLKLHFPNENVKVVEYSSPGTGNYLKFDFEPKKKGGVSKKYIRKVCKRLNDKKDIYIFNELAIPSFKTDKHTIVVHLKNGYRVIKRERPRNKNDHRLYAYYDILEWNYKKIMRESNLRELVFDKNCLVEETIKRIISKSFGFKTDASGKYFVERAPHLNTTIEKNIFHEKYNNMFGVAFEGKVIDVFTKIKKEIVIAEDPFGESLIRIRSILNERDYGPFSTTTFKGCELINFLIENVDSDLLIFSSDSFPVYKIIKFYGNEGKLCFELEKFYSRLYFSKNSLQKAFMNSFAESRRTGQNFLEYPIKADQLNKSEIELQSEAGVFLLKQRSVLDSNTIASDYNVEIYKSKIFEVEGSERHLKLLFNNISFSVKGYRNNVIDELKKNANIEFFDYFSYTVKENNVTVSLLPIYYRIGQVVVNGEEFPSKIISSVSGDMIFQPISPDVLMEYLIKGVEVRHTSDEIFADFELGKVKIKFRENSKIKKYLGDFKLQWSLSGSGYQLVDVASGFEIKGPTKSPFVFPESIEGFTYEKVNCEDAILCYEIRPNYEYVDVNIDFWVNEFQKEPRVFPPPDKLKLFWANEESIEVKTSEEKWAFSLRVQSSGIKDFRNRLKGIYGIDSDGINLAKHREIKNNQDGSWNVSLNLYSSKDRVLIIYYPLQYRTSFRSSAMHQKEDDQADSKVYAGFRYLDSQLQDLVEELDKQEIYSKIFFRFSDHHFVEYNTPGFSQVKLMKGYDYYDKDDYSWSDSGFYGDYDREIDPTTTYVDVLFFGSFGSATQLKSRFSNRTEAAKSIHVVNFLNEKQKSRFKEDRLSGTNLNHFPVSFKDLLDQREILTNGLIQKILQ